MVDGEAVTEITKQAVFASATDIIPATKKVGAKALELTLKKVDVLETPIITPTPVTVKEALDISLVPGFVPYGQEEKKQVIINLETTGFRPWEQRIIAIGLQDPLVPNEPPTIIMLDDEAQMIQALFTEFKAKGYNEIIGYIYSFDLQFLCIRAMKHNINSKPFFDASILDMAQALAQVKFAFVYKAQQPPPLSDLCDFLFGFPKAITDKQMITLYQQGNLEAVKEFASQQITRILAVYLLFRKIVESDIIG